jgi:uncharacterized protein (DUF433 family)
VATSARTEETVEQGGPYHYLERRPGSWRRELFLKGRNMTVGHLVYAMRANRITLEQAVENYDLPIEQIQEALRYYRFNRDLIEADVDEERRRAAARGIDVDARSVP